MPAPRFLPGLVLGWLLPLASVAAPVTVTFDGSPFQPPDTHFAIAQYDEAGFHFQPLGTLDTKPPYRMGRVGPDTSGRPNNHTVHLTLLVGDSCKVTTTGGTAFDVHSVDLGEYSTVFPTPQTATFTGRKANGEVVTVSFTTDGIIDGTGPLDDFQTFTFPDSFRGLVSLETASLLAYDNFVLEASNIVTPPPDPEPDPEPEPEPEPTIARRWMQAPVVFTGWLETETPMTIQGDYQLTKATRTSFTHRDVINYLTRIKVLYGGYAWSLHCVYDARFSDLTVGDFKFVAINSLGERVPLDGLLELVPLAQVLNGKIRVTPKRDGAYGALSEGRLYQLDVAISEIRRVNVQGRVKHTVTIKTATGEPVGILAAFKVQGSGRGSSDSLATVTFSVGKFTPVNLPDAGP